jgi:uncharacterized phage-associated protein
MNDLNKVANYFIFLHHESGDLITNLHLQKLMYYAQAWHLALKNKPLFVEDFEAWVHGPVLPSLYQRFKIYRWNPIGIKVKEPDLPTTTKKHLKEIVKVFGKFSAFELERMTHNEAPWKKARKGLPLDVNSSKIISKSSMKSYYSSL